MRLQLQPHPDYPCPAVDRIEAEAERDGQLLRLRYRLCGRIEALRLPQPSAAPERSNGLWRHSCFEAFVMPEGGDGYFELNLSPSGHWAAYLFTAYRSGMEDLPLAPPRIIADVRSNMGTLDAEVELDARGPWRLALAAVIEAGDGSLSYWALQHPPGQPDFHHRHCFAAELPPAGWTS